MTTPKQLKRRSREKVGRAKAIPFDTLPAATMSDAVFTSLRAAIVGKGHGKISFGPGASGIHQMHDAARF